MRRLAFTYALVLATQIGCATTSRLATPTFATGTWRVRIDIDSAPTRRVLKQTLFGTIDFANKRFTIDFEHSIGHVLQNAARIASDSTAEISTKQYRIVLGDSASVDEKIVMRGHLVARDSIVGVWTETILCCSAAGRFSLWRAAAGEKPGR